jgi:hypothetical protein
VVTHDLKSGQALAALADDKCLAFTDGPGSPHVYTVTPKQGEFVLKRAWLDLTGEPQLTFASGSDGRLLRGFDTNHVWGGIEALSRVLVVSSPIVTELTSLYEAQGILRAPAGAENLGVWAESTSTGYRVVGWSPDDGMVPLAGGQWGVAALGASSSRVVWAAGTGPRIADGAYEGGSMMWCERAEGLATCELQSGAKLPITSSAPFLVTEGDVAAFSACVGDDCGVYVTHLDDGTLFRYAAGADHSLDVLGVDSQYLYVADHQGPDQRGSVLFGSILRIELAALPSLAQEL